MFVIDVGMLIKLHDHMTYCLLALGHIHYKDMVAITLFTCHSNVSFFSHKLGSLFLLRTLLQLPSQVEERARFKASHASNKQCMSLCESVNKIPV